MTWNGSHQSYARKKCGGMSSKSTHRNNKNSQKKFYLFFVLVITLGVFFTFTKYQKTNTSAEAERVIKKTIDRIPSTNKTKKNHKSAIKDNKDAAKKNRDDVMKLSPEERYQRVLDRFRKVGLSNSRTNRLFQSSIENKMAEALLAEILISKNPIIETDDERQKEKKEVVQLAKKELIAYIKEGGDPDDFLAYYQGQLKMAHKEYMDARKSVFDVMRNDPDIAAEYIDKVNTSLREKGIKEVVVPQKALDAFGIILKSEN